jgi:hypothetical protein
MPGESEKNKKNRSQDSAPAGIQTEQFPNPSQKDCPFSSFLVAADGPLCEAGTT